MFITITKNFEHLGTTYQLGQLLDVENSVGADFIQHKCAEHAKFKSAAERLAAREAERARLNPVPPATVAWAVVNGTFTERYFISAKCSRPNCTLLHYDAPPSETLEQIQFLHSCGGFAPEKIPAAICAQYRNLFKPSVPGTDNVSLDLVHYYHNCQKSKGDGERVDLYAPQMINGVVVGPPILGSHPINTKHNNYGWENARPNPGDGQKADLSAASPVFAKK